MPRLSFELGPGVTLCKDDFSANEKLAWYHIYTGGMRVKGWEKPGTPSYEWIAEQSSTFVRDCGETTVRCAVKSISQIMEDEDCDALEASKLLSQQGSSKRQGAHGKLVGDSSKSLLKIFELEPRLTDEQAMTRLIQESYSFEAWATDAEGAPRWWKLAHPGQAYDGRPSRTAIVHWRQRHRIALIVPLSVV